MCVCTSFGNQSSLFTMLALGIEFRSSYDRKSTCIYGATLLAPISGYFESCNYITVLYKLLEDLRQRTVRL